MVCERCGRRFDSSVPESNAENYSNTVKYCCPYCGKAYLFRGVVSVKINPLSDDNIPEEDDWGQKVVSDKEYNEAHKNE